MKPERPVSIKSLPESPMPVAHELLPQVSRVITTHHELRIELPLRLTLESLAYIGVVSQRTWHVTPHDHDHFELCLVTEGRGWFALDTVLYPVREGDLFLTKPQEVHHGAALGKSPFRLYFLGFHLGAMWGRRTTVSLLGREVDAFGPEDTLLLLCLHGSKHLWSGLVWVCDVAEYLRAHPALDWARFIETAAQSQLLTAALLGPWLAHSVLDAPLSDDMQARVAADPLASRLGRTLVARWYQQPMTRHDALFSLYLRLRLHFGDAGLPLYSRLVKRVLKPQGVDYRAGGRLGAHLSRSLRLTRRLLVPADTARGPTGPPRGGRNRGSR